MADPFTALSTAAAAFQIGQMAMDMGNYLYKLGKAISKVDQTVSSLAVEAEALYQACNLISQEIKGVLPAPGLKNERPYDEDGSLWRSVTLHLMDTRVTVGDLQQVVGDDTEESKDFFQRARKQMHLDKNKDELESIRRRLHTHTQSLQMALQMVNIKIAHLAPKIVTDDLGVKIEDLKTGIQNLQSNFQANGQKGITPSEVDLIQCAKEIMRSGKTLCEESLAGDYMQRGEGAARINRLVAEWAGDVESLRRDTEASGLSDTTTQTSNLFSEDNWPATSTAHTTAGDEADDDQVRKDIDESDKVDDDFVLEIVQAALEQGQQAFDQEDWDEAETLLKEALKDLKSLPPRRRAGCDLFELEYRLTLCAYHTREPAVAKEALMSLVGQTPTSDEQKARIYDAAHLLAQLHVREGELEPARMTCESTLKARSKLLGKTHDSYLESLALMAHVYFLLGNAPRARVFMGMIPGSRRTALREGLQILPTQSPTTLADEVITTRAIEPTSHSYPDLRQSSTTDVRDLPSPDTQRSYSDTVLSQTQAPGESRHAVIGGSGHGKQETEETVQIHTAELQPAGDSRAESSLTVNVDSLERQAGLPDKSTTIDKTAKDFILTNMELAPRGKLERAICEGELEVALLLAKEADQKTRDSNALALVFASAFGDFEIAVVLIEHGWAANARVDGTNGATRSPLTEALIVRRPTMVQLLLQHGAELTPTQNRYASPLLLRAGRVLSSWSLLPYPATGPSEILSCISLLLDNGWGIDQTTSLGPTNEGADIHIRPLLWQAIVCQPLALAIRCDVIKALLEKGASLLVLGDGKHPMLHEAIRVNRPEVLPFLLKGDTKQQLLEQRFISGEENDQHVDALYYAVQLTMRQRLDISCVQVLLDAGADINSKNVSLEKDLPKSLRAAKSGFKKMLESSNALRTVTPLQLATASGNADLIRIMNRGKKPDGAR
ncbi:hypothetical protein LTR56_020380 [Elasticomyces elasticus]|nr:hypothetical protein LTR56_020380 [Elasticomyces elasticus]KAK3633104.1 hypothetical protein LTR22_020302 [Elasticomyces elasticus]KAK4910238.1 hypothetical protein LTR49_021055 [Elasticomyces elasticus]